MPLFRSAAANFRSQPAPALNYEELVNTIKTLFFRRYYKKCANRCLQYLSEYGTEIHPTYVVFLYFFAGISNDCYARGMPSRSPLIPSTIDEAETFFAKAQDLLYTARVINTRATTPMPQHEEGADDSDDSYSPQSMYRSLHSEDTHSRPSTADTSISTYSSLTDIENALLEAYPESRPSPLHVNKYESLPDTPSKHPAYSTSLYSLQPASPDGFTSRPSPRLASFYLLKFNEEETPLPYFEQERPVSLAISEDHTCHEPLPEVDPVDTYNTALAAFSDMLSTHIASLRRFREATMSSHFSSARCRPVSQVGDDSRKMGPEERMERITRGRARKWARPRFDPQRYRDLCEMAIAEL